MNAKSPCCSRCKTRRDLAATSLSLAAEADKTALRLFGTAGLILGLRSD